MVCGWYHLDIIWISPTYHPNIIQISSIYYTYHPNIIHISSRYHPHIVQISFFTTPQLGEKSSFNPYMARLLPVKTPFLNSIKTPLLIIQILIKYHPEIIQKPSGYHLVDIDFYSPPTWWKVEFQSRYSTTIAGENFTFKLY